MRYHLLTAVLAFILGLTVGGLAVGQKRSAEVSATKPAAVPSDTGGALSVTPDVPDRSDSTVVQQKSGSPSLDENLAASASVASVAEIGPIGEEGQIRVLNARWSNLERLVDRLAKRVRGLERELVTLQMAQSDGQALPEADETAPEVMPTDTPEDRQAALVAAGVPSISAEEIVWRQSELELERLELQDRAMREDWYRTSRYYDELRGLNSDALDLRQEIGEPAFDQYLYQTGQSNRVMVTSVIQGSAAEQSGLLPGDVIESYGDARIFEFSDLRSATSEGTRGEMIPVLIRRDGIYVETVMERGPMGVRLEALTAAPSG